MSEHTKVPWRVDPDGAGDVQTMDGEDIGFAIGGTIHEQAANARFIVLSANNHAALVEALDGLRDAYAAVCERHGEPFHKHRASWHGVATALLAKVSQEAA